MTREGILHDHAEENKETSEVKTWAATNLGFQQSIPKNATAAQKPENPDVSSFVLTEYSNSKKEKQLFLLPQSAELDPQNLIAQHAHLSATRKQ